MYYRSHDSHAGWGYIKVSDLPDDGVAGVIKEVLEDAGKTELEFECEGKSVNCDCGDALPLIKYGEGSQTVCVEFTTEVSFSGDKAYIDFNAVAAEDSSFSEPRYYRNDIPIEWEVTIEETPDPTEANPNNKLYTARVYVDGELAGSLNYPTTALNYASSSIRSAIESSVEKKVQEKLKYIVDNPLNGNRPLITASEANSIVNISGVSTTSDSSGTVYIPNMTTTDRQRYLYGGGSAWQWRVVFLKVRKQVEDGSSYSRNLFDLPAYNLTGTEFRVYDSNGNLLYDTLDGTSVMEVSGKSGGTTNTLALHYSWANKTVYIEETLPNRAVGYKEPTTTAVQLGEIGETTTVKIENVPIHDPVSIQIQKKSNISKDKWIGDPILNGIEYTLEYYTTKSAAISGSSPTITWKFETDKNGLIDFRNKSQLKSGTPYTQDGEIIYPLGFYRVYESTSSDVLHNRGLEKNLDIYYLEVHNNGDNEGITTVYSDKFITKPGNVYNNDTTAATIYRLDTQNTFGTIEKEHWEPFAFVKKDIYLVSGKPEGDAQLEGTTFRLYSEDLDRFKCDGKNLTEYDGNKYSINQDTGEVEVNGKTFLMTVDSNGAYKYPYPLPRTDFTNGSRFYIKEIDEQTGYQKSDIKYYIDFGSRTNGNTRTTVRDYNGNTISLEVKNMETDVYVKIQ